MSSPSGFGPVSRALTEELREEARKHGLVVWLDKDGLYREYAAALAEQAEQGGFPFPVIPFAGSFLELLFALEGIADKVDPEPAIVHVPGYNREEALQTPLCELCKAGHVHQRALATLAREAALGHVRPAALDALTAQPPKSLAEADAWLQAELSGGSSTDGADGGGPILPRLSPQALYDELVRLYDGAPPADGLASQVRNPETRAALWDDLEKRLGLSARFRQSLGDADPNHPDTIAFTLSSWAMAVEFTHDLARPPLDELLKPPAALARELVKPCRALADHLRMGHSARYARDADELETRLPEESRRASASDLGAIDTFRFEDRKVLQASLEALLQGHYTVAADYARSRTPERSFWVRSDPQRKAAWHLVRLCAQLGTQLAEQANLLWKVNSLAAAAERYAERGQQVDRAQRELEQERTKLQPIQLSEFPKLRACLDDLRLRYRAWADTQAQRFNALCQQHGFIPAAESQQRTLFEQVVAPAAGRELTAYFMVDALRYEMAAQLQEWLRKEPGTEVHLSPRLAELPTLTAVGMNVLPPAAQHKRLHPELKDGQFLGFRVGQARVFDPKSREKAIHERVGGESCPGLSLEELLDRDEKKLRQSLARARLLVVHAEGIDKAGEKGVGLRHFHDELVRLRDACRLLREAGVRTFILTADHGFLLQDKTSLQPIERGRKIDPKRRHVIDRVGANQPDQVRVALSELDYDGDVAGLHLHMPVSSQPFAVSEPSNFVHGGNSLQERVIPVLTLQVRNRPGSESTRYQIEGEALSPERGLHRLAAAVLERDQTSLSFAGRGQVELRLRALDDPAIKVALVEVRAARSEGGLEAAGSHDAPPRLEAGAIVAPVKTRFELLFRLTGTRPLRAKLQLESALHLVEIDPLLLERRFAVEVEHRVDAADSELAPSDSGPSGSGGPGDWLQDLPAGAVRDVFSHIAQHGGINEADATRLLGGARQFRRFSQEFEQHAEKAPFGVRIDTASGQKRYVREG